jgi:phosphate transport system protein
VAAVELRTNFHNQLRATESKVRQLFAFVADDLAGATQALLSGDQHIVAILSEREQAIDGLYKEVEALVDQQVALQAPVASDLRFLLSVLRVVPELERSHDLVVHVAYHATHILRDELSPRTRGLVQRMGTIGSDMWLRAGSAWHERDAGVAEQLDELDEEMDALHVALVAELAAGHMTLPVTMDMTLVARFYERLGDHAVNVARRVVFMAGLPALP